MSALARSRLDPPFRQCFIPPCETAVPIRRSQVARTFKAASGGSSKCDSAPGGSHACRSLSAKDACSIHRRLPVLLPALAGALARTAVSVAPYTLDRKSSSLGRMFTDASPKAFKHVPGVVPGLRSTVMVAIDPKILIFAQH